MIVVSTNNRSYHRSGNSEQHLANSQIHAAETARPVLQASVSGISAVIDPDGSVHDTTNLFEKAIVRATIRTTTGETPFVRFGDWVVVLSSLALVGAAVTAFVRARGPQQLDRGDQPDHDDDAAQQRRRHPPSEVGAELRTGDRSDGNERGDVPGHVGGEHEHERGDAVGNRSEHVLDPVEPLEVVGDEDPEQREQDHALAAPK